MNLNKEAYTLIQLDIIKEFANIGGGNAATSISQLVDKPISMSVPTIDIHHYNELFERVMPEDEMVNAVIIRVSGDAEGLFLFITTMETYINLVNMMIPENMEVNNELCNSAMKELVNILVSSYIRAISEMVHINLVSSVPYLTVDMFGSIVSSAYIESEQYDEDIMIIKNEFLYQGERIESSLYFIPKPGVLDGLFKIIGV